MPVNDHLGKRMKENAVDGMIPVALVNGDTGQPFDTKEDFFEAVRKLVATKKNEVTVSMHAFRIEFTVDNGVSYDRDVALVMAQNMDEASEKLRRLINAIDSETCVAKIHKMIIFTGDVFTGQHGWN
jgi:hypothetical protein